MMNAFKLIRLTLQSLSLRNISGSARFSSSPAHTRKRAASDKGADAEQPIASASPLLVSKKKGVLTIILNRSAVLNAMDMEMAEALQMHLQAAATDPDIRALVISGKGRAFCAGGDLKFALQANPEQPGDSFLALTSVLHACIALIRSMDKPVVAAINGPAAGAGLFLALACDLRIMSQTAYLKQSNTSYGLSLPAGGTFFLPRLLGMGRALEMVMLDQPIDAQTAQMMGMVTKVVSAPTLMAEAALLAVQLTQRPVQALGQVKRLMNASFHRSLDDQLVAEQQAIVQSANHAEGREGLSAFVEKRKAEYASLR